MFIQTEYTPNPATLKFLPGVEVLATGSANFVDAAAAEISPLAHGLFGIEGVTGVFLGADFITVTKEENQNWDVLKPAILAAIMDHFKNGTPVMDPAATNAAGANEDDDPIVKKIKELLDNRVRPQVAQDGGDIVFHGYREGVVFLQMQGSCAGCPSSTATLKMGVERMLQHYIPEVREVRSIV